jgi:hypothetical protein
MARTFAKPLSISRRAARALDSSCSQVQYVMIVAPRGSSDARVSTSGSGIKIAPGRCPIS